MITKKFIIVNLLALGIGVATAAFWPFGDTGFIKSAERYGSKNTDIDKKLKENLLEIVSIMESNPGLSNASTEHEGREGRLCYSYLEQTRDCLGISSQLLHRNECKDQLAFSAALAASYCNELVANRANAVLAKKFQEKVGDLERQAEELGIVRNSKNVIPKYGSSCPSGYKSDGDYCTQR